MHCITQTHTYQQMVWTLTARLSAIFLASASESDCLKTYNSQMKMEIIYFYTHLVSMQPVKLRSENWIIIRGILLSDTVHAFDRHDHQTCLVPVGLSSRPSQPHLCYTTEVLSPGLKSLKLKIERFQRRATRWFYAESLVRRRTKRDWSLWTCFLLLAMEKLKALALRSDEGLTLETSASQSLNGGTIHIINPVDKT